MFASRACALLLSALASCGSPERPIDVASTSDGPPAAETGAGPLPRNIPPEPGDIDLSQAKEPPQVWSYATDGGEPLVIAGLVIVQDAGGESVSAVAPDTGKRVWQLAAPDGVTFSAVEKGSRDAVYVAGYSPDGGTLSRVDPKTGKLVWRIEGPAGVTLGHDGTGGVVAADACASSVIDLDSGRIAKTPFKDSLLRMFPSGDMAGGSRCERATLPLLRRSGVTLLALGVHSDHKLAGVNALGATSYTIALEGHPRVAAIDGDEVVLLVLGDAMQAMRVNVVSGAVRFRSRLAEAEGCKSDKSGYYAEAARSMKGKEQLFVRGCGRATLIDMVTGAAVWSADVGADAAFLTGAPTKPWESPATVEVSSAPLLAARLFNLNGRVEQTIQLPADTREVMPVAGGVVATNGGHDITAFFDAAGRRWRLPLKLGSSALLGQHFMALGSQKAAQVVIEPRSGKAFVVSGCGSAKCTSGSPYAVGQVGDLWLTTRTDPDELFAVRLTP